MGTLCPFYAVSLQPLSGWNLPLTFSVINSSSGIRSILPYEGLVARISVVCAHQCWSVRMTLFFILFHKGGVASGALVRTITSKTQKSVRLSAKHPNCVLVRAILLNTELKYNG